MKKENEALTKEVKIIIGSLNQRLIKNRRQLRDLSEENRTIKRELSACMRLKNLIAKEIM